MSRANTPLSVRPRSLRIAVTVLLAVLVAVPMTALSSVMAHAATTVRVNQVTGTPGWDAQSDPARGMDANATDNVIRVNDYITYNVEILSTSDVASSTIVLTLPQGYEVLPSGGQLNALPAFCGTGSSATAPSPTPGPGLTATSYQSLNAQVVTCVVAGQNADVVKAYPITAKVRSELPPNFTGTAKAQVTTGETTSEASSPESVVASAPRWNIATTGMSVAPSTGFASPLQLGCPTPGSGNPPSPFVAASPCTYMRFFYTMHAENGGKGAMPLTNDGIQFTWDLRPEAVYSPHSSGDNLTGPSTSDRLLRPWANAGTATTAGDCQAGGAYAGVPGHTVGTSGWTTTNAARNSGTVNCSDATGVSSNQYVVKVTGADTSLYTYPSVDVGGGAVPANRAVAVSKRIQFTVPTAAVQAFGTNVTINDIDYRQLNANLVFRNLQVTGIHGGGNVAGSDAGLQTGTNGETDNTYLTYVRLQSGGLYSVKFVGNPNESTNTPAIEFNSGEPRWEGPPAQQTIRSGNISVQPGQVVLANMELQGMQYSTVGRAPGTAIACTTWDPTEFRIAPGDYQRSKTGNNASGGAAAWYLTSSDGYRLPAENYVIQYGVGGELAGQDNCTGGTWYSSLDAAQAAGTVDQVRVWAKLPAGTFKNAANQDVQLKLNSHEFGVALEVIARAPGNTLGDRLPIYGSVSFDFTAPDRTLEQMLAQPQPWRDSTYNVDAHTGRQGDRLILSDVYVRADLQSANAPTDAFPADTAYSDAQKSVTGGDRVAFRVTPSIRTSGTGSSVTHPVWVDMCLPEGLRLSDWRWDSDRTLAPAPGDPASCSGGTAVRFNLGSYSTSDTIAPFYVMASTLPSATPGLRTATTLVASPADRSTVAQRDDASNVLIVQPTGVYVQISAVQSFVEVNRDWETNLDPVQWELKAGNIASQGLSGPDMIFVLPVQGVDGTSYDGTLTFQSVEITDATGGEIVLRTSSATVSSDPTDPTNAVTTSPRARQALTVWCDANGEVYSGTGTTADCPQSDEDVTAVRVIRPGDFNEGATLTAIVSLLPEDNRGGNIYVPQMAGHVQGLTSTITPARAPIQIMSSTLGDLIWHDRNQNGLQDDGDNAGMAGITVRLTGVDASGNAVELQTVTDANGRYVFDELESGQLGDGEGYHLEVIAPAGYAFSPQRTGTGFNDSAVDATGKVSGSVLPNSENLTLDAGLYLAPTAAKSVNPSSGTNVTPGQDLTFTLTFTNPGDVAREIDYTDDLADLVDDAEITGRPQVTGDDVTASAVTDNMFTVTGTLAPGAEVTVTYTATVKSAAELGDGIVRNRAYETGATPDTGECAEGDQLCTENVVDALTVTKSVDPEDGSIVDPGAELTYTITLTNDGGAAAEVDYTDVLADLVDDATITEAPQVTSGEGVTVSEVADGQFTITGSLAPDSSAVITYTATVKPTAELGNGQVGNVVVETGETPPEECATDDPACTNNPVRAFTVSKTANPSSGSAVRPGQEITYELIFRNNGGAPATVDHADHLAGVLDDATITGQPEITVGSGLDVGAVADGTFTVTGEMSANTTVVVSYTVTVNDRDDLGDEVVRNVVVVTGDEPPAGECAIDDARCTENPVDTTEEPAPTPGPSAEPTPGASPSPSDPANPDRPRQPMLPSTGATVGLLTVLLAVGAVIAGGLLVRRRRG